MNFRRSIPVFLAATALSSLVACTSVSNQQESDKYAAYAASTSFPSNIKAEEAHEIGVLVEPSSKNIEILNFSKYELDNADVWVNGTYVYKVDTIPPDGYVKLSLDDFFDHSGHSFTSAQANVDTVQIKAGDHLWNLLGPMQH